MIFFLRYFFLFSVFVNSVQAQFIINQTQQAYGTIQLNPGYSALHETAKASFSSRYQWLGFEGAPLTQIFTFHTPIGLSNTYLGLLLISDKIGAEQNTGFIFNYSTKIQINHKFRASLGFLVGYGFHSSDFNVASSGQPDSLFEDYKLSNALLGIGATIFSDKFYMGVSAPFLIATKIGGTGEISTEPYQSDFYLQTSYIFNIGTNHILKPSLVYRYLRKFDNIMDIGFTLYLKEKYNLGLIFRPGLSVALSVGVNFFNTIDLIYTNDIISSQLQSFSRGSHEFSLKFDFNLFPSRQSVPKCYY